MEEPTFDTDVSAPTERYAPPPRRLRRSLLVMIPVIATYFVAGIVTGGGRDFARNVDFAGWWALLVGAVSTLAIAFGAHPSSRVRLVTHWLGVLPFLALEAHLAFSPPRPAGLGEVASLLTALWAGAWPLSIALGSVLLGVLFDVLRERIGLSRRAHPAMAACVALVAGVLVTVSVVGWGEPPASVLTEDAVVLGPPLRADDAGRIDVARTMFFSREDEGVVRWDLHPLIGRGGVPLGPSVELVDSHGRLFLRSEGASDPSTWARVDRAAGELRPLGFADVPLPIEAPRSASLSLAVAILFALGCLLRLLWLARLRRRVSLGDQARVDAEGVAIVGAHRVVLAPAPPPGPVVLFGGVSADGSYRLAPSITVSGFISGTRFGRRLRLSSAMRETWMWIAWCLLLGVVPALVALAHGRLLPSLF